VVELGHFGCWNTDGVSTEKELEDALLVLYSEWKQLLTLA
jgi:hypothetical protein